LFNSVDIIVVHVQTCFLAVVHHKLIQIMVWHPQSWK